MAGADPSGYDSGYESGPDSGSSTKPTTTPTSAIPMGYAGYPGSYMGAGGSMYPGGGINTTGYIGNTPMMYQPLSSAQTQMGTVSGNGEGLKPQSEALGYNRDNESKNFQSNTKFAADQEHKNDAITLAQYCGIGAILGAGIGTMTGMVRSTKLKSDGKVATNKETGKPVKQTSKFKGCGIGALVGLGAGGLGYLMTSN